MTKPYSYLSERVQILKKRKLKIGTTLEEKNILKEYNYYNLVNAYKDPFLKTGISSGKEEFNNNVKLCDLKALAEFDKDIRLILLKNILIIEEKIKTNLVESFYLVHDSNSKNLENDRIFLKKMYYDTGNIYYKEIFDKRRKTFYVRYYDSRPRKGDFDTINRKKIYRDFVERCDAVINRQMKKNKNKNNSIKSYMNKHGIVPLWILVNDLTLGNIGYFYKIQKKEVQVLFLKRLGLYNLKNIDELDLIFNFATILEIITLCRNICAHNERLYNYEINRGISDNAFLFSEALPSGNLLKQGRSINNSQSEKRRHSRESMYTFIYCIYLLLDKEDKSTYLTEINNCLDNLRENLIDQSELDNKIKKYLNNNNSKKIDIILKEKKLEEKIINIKKEMQNQRIEQIKENEIKKEIERLESKEIEYKKILRYTGMNFNWYESLKRVK